MARAQDSLTHRGTVISGISWKVNRARVMMPMVFWASFKPWLVAMNAEEAICNFLNRWLTRDGGVCTKSQDRETISR
jgi:hypothetical protein